MRVAIPIVAVALALAACPAETSETPDAVAEVDTPEVPDDVEDEQTGDTPDSSDADADAAPDLTDTPDAADTDAADTTDVTDVEADSGTETTQTDGEVSETLADAEVSGGCPPTPGAFGGSCDFIGQCTYGEECCCGQCFDSLVCSCDNGQMSCYNTDACLLPNCPDASDASDVDAPGPPDTTDATSDLGPDAGIEPGQCAEEADCTNGPGFLCWAPDEVLPCGICMTPPDTCADDAACKAVNADDVCKPAQCACAGEKTCQPGCLGDDANCAQGQTCGTDGNCAATTCAIDGDCPTDFVCGQGGGCQRKACASSLECSGYCVKGFCYDTPGYCSPVPP